MKITSVEIIENCVSKEELFSQIAQIFREKSIIIDESEFIQALIERESQVSTGFIDGFAIPHGKSKTVIEPGIIFLKLNPGINWESMDGELITSVFALAIPSSGSAEHLKALTLISRKLVDENFRNNLKSATSKEEITKYLQLILNNPN